MPNSQIDMVVRHGDGWRVCGDFDKQEGRPDQDVDLYVVVRQGDVVARGHDVVSSRKEWRFEVEPEGGDFVVGQPAIATAVAIAKEDLAGLEAFTWAQQIPVIQRRTDGNPPPQFRRAGDGLWSRRAGGRPLHLLVADPPGGRGRGRRRTARMAA